MRDFKGDIFSYDFDNDAFFIIVNSLNNINEENMRYIIN